MKNLSVIPGILALIGVCVLFYTTSKHANTAPAINPSAATPAENFRIAYFNLDSLEAHYDYFKDVTKQIKAKENSMNEELGGMERSYQAKIAEWQKKANTMTQAEGQQAQQEYAQMQQNYQAKKQSLQESLFKHNEDMKADIRKAIEDYLREYNKNRKYAFIFADEGNTYSFMYAKDTTYDITPDLITGLNAGYQKKK